MLDSADLKHALKVTSADLKQALKVTNRNERAADAVAALVGKSVALNAIPKLSDIPEKTEELVRRKQILADMAAYSVDYRTNSPGRGVEVLQQYKEYCSRNPVQQHWG